MSYIIWALAIALGLSTVGNVVVGSAYLSQRDTATEAKAASQGNADLAKSCSDGVLSLQADAARRVAEAEGKVAAAAAKRRTGDKRADDILSRTPKVPADLCASAQVEIDEWLSTR